MTRLRISLSIGTAALSLFLAAAPAKALNRVSFVSAFTGNIANTCDSPANACETIAAALANTMVGGEIRCLDSHINVGVTITIPVTIDCDAPSSVIRGGGGGPGFPSAVAITVNLDEGTFPNGVVTLRNIKLQGFLGSGTKGIRVIGGGAAVHIENVTINGFAEQGIDFSPSSNVDLFVKDTMISNNSGGILVAPAAGGRVSLSNVRLDQNAVFGLTVSKASGTFAAVTIEDSNIEKSVVGLRAIGASAFIALSDSVVTNNSTGLLVQSGGKINSAGNNMITLNNVNGVPTAKFALQ